MSITGNAIAETAFYDSIDAFKKETLKGTDSIELEAKGDLNGDGLQDWVGIIFRDKDGFPRKHQLYVLLQDPAHGYAFVASSSEAEVAGMGCCWVEDLNIKRASILIQNNVKTASSMEAATHQFKLYHGIWRLIGLTIYDVDLEKDQSIKTDINLLTGDVIQTEQSGNEKPVMAKRKIKPSVFLLKDYDFYNDFGIE